MPIELIPTTSVGVFKQEMLDQFLPEVIELWKSEKRNLELAILQQVKKVEEGTIFIEVMGHVQEEIAEKMKPDLIGIFRKKSGAGKIAIQLDVKEEDDAGSPKLYTDQDKFKHLLKKHPALLEFSKKFDLDPDF
jgi:exoribonuclease R